jgi:hypothetical protein
MTAEEKSLRLETPYFTLLPLPVPPELIIVGRNQGKQTHLHSFLEPICSGSGRDEFFGEKIGAGKMK